MARILLALVLSAGCRIATFASENEPMTPQVHVELDIFSGRPNPEWVLTDDEAEAFMARLEAAGQPSNARLSNHLGYRGFVIRIQRDSGEQAVQIQNGSIFSAGAGSLPARKDGGRALERLLLETARPHVAAEILKFAEDDLKR